MCGIAAIFAYHSSAPGVDDGELRTIRDCMTARGPDGTGDWYDAGRRVGLGHRRLSIIDLSPGGAQPMLWPERKLAITFNGEIYNYRELRAALERKGHFFKSTSDTEVLLHLYAEHGEAMVNELRGMYAFAIWDGVKRGLLLARDPFGIKPLYWADDGKTLRTASQVKALLAGGRVNTAPDPAGHVGFFLWGHVPEPYTFYRAIRMLAPGTTMWVDQNGNKRTLTFCTITAMFAHAERAGAPISRSARNGETLPHANREIGDPLRDSVRHHLVADVPVGVFLSSGLDSTTLTALAAEEGGTLRTVTLGFEEYRGTENDETPLAEAVARQYGTQHQTVWVSRDDFRAHVERLFHAMDQPSTDGVNTYFVSLAAAQTSLKVALSGLGGDELFGGYPSFAEIPRAVRFLKPFNAPALQPFNRAFRVVAAPLLKHFTSPKYAGLLEYGGGFGGAYLLRRGMFMPWELPELLDADLVREGWTELQSLVHLDESVAGLHSARAKVSSLEIGWYMRNQLLRDSDWAGMAHSLEIRVPLVDVALFRSLAPALVCANPPTKLDMASSPKSQLPPSVLNRPKTGFSIPVRDWLLSGPQPSTLNPQLAGARGLRGWARQVYARFGEQGAGIGEQAKRAQSSRASKPVAGWAAAAAAATDLSEKKRLSLLSAEPERAPIRDEGELSFAQICLARADAKPTLPREPGIAAPVQRLNAPAFDSGKSLHEPKRAAGILPAELERGPAGELPAARLLQEIGAPVQTDSGVRERSSSSNTAKTQKKIGRVMVLVTDAFGGRGGIAKFNRDLLSALCAYPGIEEVVAVTRLLPEPPGVLPGKLNYVTFGVGGKLRYIISVLKLANGRQQPVPDQLSTLNSQPSTAFDLIICGHINLLPIACLASWLSRKAESRKQKAEIEPPSNVQSPISNLPSPVVRGQLSRGPSADGPEFQAPSLLLVVHGIDAWQPTRSWLVNRLVRKIDAFISVSELTRQRFLAWTKLDGLRSFILPNCVELSRFGPGPKNPALLQRYQLQGRTVLLTVGRLASAERYKGFDEVLAVLPELAKQIPNLTYLIVGHGDDRERLEQKARSLGLAVGTTDHGLFQKSAIRNPQSAIENPLPPTPHVIFAGHIPEAEKVDHYRLADVYVMPGWGEGFGIVYLEALACGVPAIGSKLDGSSAALRGGQLGILVDPGNPLEIIQAIKTALRMPRCVVPDGLDYFSQASFDQRCHQMLAALWQKLKVET